MSRARPLDADLAVAERSDSFGRRSEGRDIHGRRVAQHQVVRADAARLKLGHDHGERGVQRDGQRPRCPRRSMQHQADHKWGRQDAVLDGGDDRVDDDRVLGRAWITFSMPLFGESSPNVSKTSFPSVPKASL